MVVAVVVVLVVVANVGDAMPQEGIESGLAGARAMDFFLRGEIWRNLHEQIWH